MSPVAAVSLEPEADQFNGTLRYSDLLAFQFVGLRRRLKGLAVFLVVFFVVLNTIRLFVAPGLSAQRVVLPQLAILVAVLATLVFQILMQPFAWLAKPYNRSIVTVNSANIAFRRRVGSVTIPWTNVKRVVETSTHIFLILREGTLFHRTQACVLPKRQMGDDITRRIIHLASNKGL